MLYSSVICKNRDKIRLWNHTSTTPDAAIQRSWNSRVVPAGRSSLRHRSGGPKSEFFKGAFNSAAALHVDALHALLTQSVTPTHSASLQHQLGSTLFSSANCRRQKLKLRRFWMNSLPICEYSSLMLRKGTRCLPPGRYIAGIKDVFFKHVTAVDDGMASKEAGVGPPNICVPSTSRASVRTRTRARYTSQSASEVVILSDREKKIIPARSRTEDCAPFLKRSVTAPSQTALKEPGTTAAVIEPNRRQHSWNNRFGGTDEDEVNLFQDTEPPVLTVGAQAGSVLDTPVRLLKEYLAARRRPPRFHALPLVRE